MADYDAVDERPRMKSTSPGRALSCALTTREEEEDLGPGLGEQLEEMLPLNEDLEEMLPLNAAVVSGKLAILIKWPAGQIRHKI